MNGKVKQQLGLLVSSSVPIMMFMGGLFGSHNLLIGAGCGILGVIPAFLVGKGLMKSPMDALINGKPLVFDLNSSGMLQAYEVQLDLPLMRVKLSKDRVLETKFDRKLAIPFNLLMKKKQITYDDKGKIVFKNEKFDELMSKQYILNKNATVFVINSPTGSFISKEQLANMENTLATENLTLYQLELTKNMSRDVRQLGKTFMANLGGSEFFDILKNPMVQGIIIAGVILLIAILVGPMIFNALGVGANAVGGTAVNVPGVPVTR
jgi:hypothetical protein